MIIRETRACMRIPPLLLAAALATGCAGSPNREAPGQLFAEPILPSVAVFPKPVTGELAELCVTYATSAQLRGCTREPFTLPELARWVGATGVFEAVHPRGRAPGYQLYIAHLLLYEETAGNLANAILSGATLTAVPLPCDMMLHAEIDLIWRGTRLRSDRYEIPWNRSNCATLSKQRQEMQREALISDLLQSYVDDVLATDAFAPHVLHAAIGSSNYLDDLAAPLEIGDWYLESRHLYHDPLLGMNLRYRHFDKLLDWMDVYVYPIRSSDLEDTAALMLAESLIVREEINDLAELGLIRNVIHEDNRAVQPAPEGYPDGGLEFRTHWLDEYDVAHESRTWLFRSDDKWIKLRFTTEDADGELLLRDFVAQLVTDIRVPGESAWMANLRRRVADNEQ